MSFLIGLASSLIEKFVKWFVVFIAKFIAEKKEIKQDEETAKKNAQDLINEKDREAQRRKSQDLLNGN